MSVFISYRRGATEDIVGRIRDRLAHSFSNVFQDVESIEIGVDFVERTDRALQQANAVLVVIGPDWTRDGGIHSPQDLVRLEVERALARPGLFVVPVLVGGRRMPTAADLPESLLPLLRLNAVSVESGREFDNQMKRLADALAPHVPPAEPRLPPEVVPQGRGRTQFAVGAVLVAGATVAIIFATSDRQRTNPIEKPTPLPMEPTTHVSPATDPRSQTTSDGQVPRAPSAREGHGESAGTNLGDERPRVGPAGAKPCTKAREVCDGEDNDCDTRIDEHLASGGPCETDAKGACRPGTLVCRNRSEVCVPTTGPRVETCDAQDNDCDGNTDEGLPPSSCTASHAKGECATGTRPCRNDALACIAGSPVAESCNGKDDDCDGRTDETCHRPVRLSSPSDARGRLGGSGGNPFGPDDCPPGYVVTALDVRAGDVVDSIKLRCGELREDGNFGRSFALSNHGGGGGSPRVLSCPRGVLRGIQGREGDVVDRVQGLCADSQAVLRGDVAVNPTRAAGGAGGKDGNSICPDGWVVTGIRGRAGAQIDQLQLRCSKLSKP